MKSKLNTFNVLTETIWMECFDTVEFDLKSFPVLLKLSKNWIIHNSQLQMNPIFVLSLLNHPSNELLMFQVEGRSPNFCIRLFFKLHHHHHFHQFCFGIKDKERGSRQIWKALCFWNKKLVSIFKRFN